MLKKTLRILALACLPLLFVACGGSSDSTASYAGHYTGNIAGDPGSTQNSGPMEFTVDAAGALKGSATVNKFPVTLVGTVSTAGVIKIQMWYGGDFAAMVMTGQVKSDNTFSGTQYENHKPAVTGTFAGKKD